MLIAEYWQALISKDAIHAIKCSWPTKHKLMQLQQTAYIINAGTCKTHHTDECVAFPVTVKEDAG